MPFQFSSREGPAIPVITRISRRSPIFAVQLEVFVGWGAVLVRATSRNRSLYKRSLGFLPACQSFEVMRPRLRKSFADACTLISLRSAETADDHGNHRQPVDSRRIEPIVSPLAKSSILRAPRTLLNSCHDNVMDTPRWSRHFILSGSAV